LEQGQGDILKNWREQFAAAAGHAMKFHRGSALSPA
jgi:hypothetical protein